MPRRRPVPPFARALAAGAIAVAGAASAAPHAAGAVRLADAPLAGLASSRGIAYAVVETEDGRGGPYALVRSGGRGGSEIGRFGRRRPEWVDVAAGPGGRVAVAWGEPISQGFEQRVAAVPERAADAFARGEVLGLGTGPGRLLLGAAGWRAVASVDRTGDAMLATAPDAGAPVAVRRLTADAPEVRHATRDAALTRRGVLVLDRAQTRSRTTLRVLGRGAPRRAVASVGARRALDASMALGPGRLVTVAYTRSGRVVLARWTGGRWRRVVLPGAGGMLGAPAVLRAGRRVHVAYSQHAGRRRDLFLATAGATGRPRVRRLTKAPEDDLGAFLAPAPRGRLYVGWTRRVPGPSGLGRALLDVVR